MDGRHRGSRSGLRWVGLGRWQPDKKGRSPPCLCFGSLAACLRVKGCLQHEAAKQPHANQRVVVLSHGLSGQGRAGRGRVTIGGGRAGTERAGVGVKGPIAPAARAGGGGGSDEGWLGILD